MLKVDNNDNLNLKFSTRNFGEFKKKMLIFHIQKQNHFIFVSCENNFVYFFIISVLTFLIRITCLWYYVVNKRKNVIHCFGTLALLF